MKIAAALALRDLAKLPVPAEVAAAYGVDSTGVRSRVHHSEAHGSASDHVGIGCRGQGGDRGGVATLPYPSHYPLQSVGDVFNG